MNGWPTYRTFRIRSGFTLFEIMVVLVVIALSALLVAPRLAESIPKYRLASSSKTMADTFKFAQNKAVSEMRPMAVILDGKNDRIMIRPLMNKDYRMRHLSAESPNEMESTVKSYDFPEGIDLKVGITGDRWEDGVSQVVFFPGGNSNGGSVRLFSKNGKEVSVIVEPFSGRVTIGPEEDQR